MLSGQTRFSSVVKTKRFGSGGALVLNDRLCGPRVSGLVERKGTSRTCIGVGNNVLIGPICLCFVMCDSGNGCILPRRAFGFLRGITATGEKGNNGCRRLGAFLSGGIKRSEIIRYDRGVHYCVGSILKV